MGILRVIYALAVFFFHSGWVGGVVILGPWKAIYSFFIISGFYMSFILNRKYIGKKNSYFLYLSNRFLRIYPIYWTLLILSIIFSTILLAFHIDNAGVLTYIHYYSYLFHHNPAMLLLTIVVDIVRNITIFIHTSYFSTFVPPEQLSTMAMSWTLRIELLFYIIAPFLVRSKGWKRFFTIGVIYLTAYTFFHYRWLDFRLTSYFFIHSLVFFMLGYISYIIFDSFPLSRIHSKIIILIAIIFFLFTLIYSSLPLPHVQYKWMVFNDWIYYASVTIAIPFVFQFSRLFKWDSKIADFSYPIYLSHFFTNQLITYAHFVKPHTQEFIFIALTATLIFSSLIIIFIERPIELYRQSRVKAATKFKKIRGITFYQD